MSTRKKHHHAITATLCAMILWCGCSPRTARITISNPTSADRVTETAEIPLAKITAALHLKAGEEFVIRDEEGKETGYQRTHDGKVIFPVQLKKSETQTFQLAAGTPQPVDTIATGRIYPLRFDDLAWENDLVGFRAYGPALQNKGEKGFGYDLFAKRGTQHPVLPQMYELETDPILKKRISELRQSDPEAAQRLHKSKSYHIDKGYGMDCYAVGATLGAGTAALVEAGEMVYPWCFKECEILDNGPLRFTARLTFTPLEAYGRNDIIESRIISLDAGAHLNKTVISYTNIEKETDIVSGIVLHDDNDFIRTEKEKGYITYQDPTTGPGKGLLYIGHAFPGPMENTQIRYFSAQESSSRNNAKGHVLAYGKYLPGKTFDYWWGFGWSKSDMKDYDSWNDYMEKFSFQLRHPLEISVSR